MSLNASLSGHFRSGYSMSVLASLQGDPQGSCPPNSHTLVVSHDVPGFVCEQEHTAEGLVCHFWDEIIKACGLHFEFSLSSLALGDGIANCRVANTLRSTQRHSHRKELRLAKLWLLQPQACLRCLQPQLTTSL